MLEWQSTLSKGDCNIALGVTIESESCGAKGIQRLFNLGLASVDRCDTTLEGSYSIAAFDVLL